MGRGNKKLVRVVFVGNKTHCPDCDFIGNRTQIKLHLRTTHQLDKTKFIMNPDSGSVCYICGVDFVTRENVQKHILKMH